ncbi:MAG TPA: hypothetical protein PKB06_05805 [Actinotalea sp.]|nr:hypothetical protein [Actinotalea sp.]
MTAWVAGVALTDVNCVAARMLPPATAHAKSPGAGRRDALFRLELETAHGRRLHVTVLGDEPIPPDSRSQVPSWAFPGAFADALANPEPREWVGLATGGDRPFTVAFVRDYVIRRLVMARHLEAARNGVVVALADDEVILDLGLDLARLPGAFVSLPGMLDEVDADPLRPGAPGASATG